MKKVYLDLLKLEFNQNSFSLYLMVYLVQGDVGKSIKTGGGVYNYLGDLGD